MLYEVITEGMAIAAHAVGADEGYLYIRAEYPLAIERVSQAFQSSRDRQVLMTRHSSFLSTRLSVSP